MGSAERHLSVAIVAGEQLKGGTGREGRHDFIFGDRSRRRKVIDGGGGVVPQRDVGASLICVCCIPAGRPSLQGRVRQQQQ